MSGLDWYMLLVWYMEYLYASHTTVELIKVSQGQYIVLCLSFKVFLFNPKIALGHNFISNKVLKKLLRETILVLIFKRAMQEKRRIVLTKHHYAVTLSIRTRRKVNARNLWILEEKASIRAKGLSEAARAAKNVVKLHNKMCWQLWFVYM